MSLLDKIFRKRNLINQERLAKEQEEQKLAEEKRIKELEEKKLEEEQRIKEAEEKQKIEKERLLNSDERVPEKYVISLNFKKNMEMNGIAFTYNHHEYFLAEIGRLDVYVTYDKKIRVKQLTGDNIGAEYMIEQIRHDGNYRKYNVYDYKGNVKQMNLGSSVDFSYIVQKLNDLAIMQNDARVEFEYRLASKKIEAERAKNNLFGV